VSSLNLFINKRVNDKGDFDRIENKKPFISDHHFFKKKILMATRRFFAPQQLNFRSDRINFDCVPATNFTLNGAPFPDKETTFSIRAFSPSPSTFAFSDTGVTLPISNGPLAANSTGVSAFSSTVIRTTKKGNYTFLVSGHLVDIKSIWVQMTGAGSFSQTFTPPAGGFPGVETSFSLTFVYTQLADGNQDHSFVVRSNSGPLTIQNYGVTVQHTGSA
jgi:hypothetical protein